MEYNVVGFLSRNVWKSCLVTLVVIVGVKIKDRHSTILCGMSLFLVHVCHQYCSIKHGGLVLWAAQMSTGHSREFRYEQYVDKTEDFS